jgi:hypothetical protein
VSHFLEVSDILGVLLVWFIEALSPILAISLIHHLVTCNSTPDTVVLCHSKCTNTFVVTSIIALTSLIIFEPIIILVKRSFSIGSLTIEVSWESSSSVPRVACIEVLRLQLISAVILPISVERWNSTTSTKVIKEAVAFGFGLRIGLWL